MEKSENQIGYGMAEETGLVLGLRNRPVREVQRADHGFAGNTELRKKAWKHARRWQNKIDGRRENRDSQSRPFRGLGQLGRAGRHQESET